jgi:hypothetical protein
VCVSLGLDRKILLTEYQTTESWYSILPNLLRPLRPIQYKKNREQQSHKTIEIIFTRELKRQEVTEDRFIWTTEQITDVYCLSKLTQIFQACYTTRKVKGDLNGPVSTKKSWDQLNERPPKGVLTREKNGGISICRI